MSNVINDYSECHNAKFRYAECHYAKHHNAECHYSECHYAECLGAPCCNKLECLHLPSVTATQV